MKTKTNIGNMSPIVLCERLDSSSASALLRRKINQHAAIAAESMRKRKTNVTNNKTKTRATCATSARKYIAQETIVKKKVVLDMKPKPYQCIHCPEGFMLEKECKAHMATSHSNPFVCRFCEKNFTTCSLGFYLRHIGLDHNFICTSCDLRFTSKSALQIHSRIHPKSELIYECERCFDVFFSQNDLARHNLTHAIRDQHLFRCKICRLIFSGVGPLAAHYRSHVNSSKNDLSSNIKKEHKEIAQTVYQTKKSPVPEAKKQIKKHKNTVKKPPKLVLSSSVQKSPFGDSAFYGRLSFGEKKPSLFACFICDIYFDNQDNLVEHIKIHLDQKGFACRACQRGYSSKEKLEEHEERLHGHKCNECGMKFVKRSHLRSHSETHVEL